MRKDRKEIQSYMIDIGYSSKDGSWKSSVDPDALELIELLNTLAGVITIASCSGHGVSGHTGEQHKAGDTPYIFLVCRDLSSQFAILNAARDIEGHVEYGFVHSEIEGPFLSIRFDEFKEMTKFHDNLIHESTELQWKKENPRT